MANRLEVDEQVLCRFVCEFSVGLVVGVAKSFVAVLEQVSLRCDHKHIFDLLV